MPSVTLAVTAAGGTSQLGGLRERLERELGEVAAQNARVKVHTPANMLERRFGVWLGELLCSVVVLVLLDCLHAGTCCQSADLVCGWVSSGASAASLLSSAAKLVTGMGQLVMQSLHVVTCCCPCCHLLLPAVAVHRSRQECRLAHSDAQKFSWTSCCVQVGPSLDRWGLSSRCGCPRRSTQSTVQQ